jgi:hypothetical protein
MRAKCAPSEVKTIIAQALDSVDLVVSFEDDQVVLDGTVKSLGQRAEAERLALISSGLSKVLNRLATTASEHAAEDPVYEAGIESFPASDPPAWASR